MVNVVTRIGSRVRTQVKIRASIYDLYNRNGLASSK